MKNSVFRGATDPAAGRGKVSWDESNQREFS